MESPAAFSEAERKERLDEWAARGDVDLAGLDGSQRGVVFAALTFLTFVRGLPALRRMVAYMLSHCGLGLSSAFIEAVVGTTDRAVRKGRQLKLTVVPELPVVIDADSGAKRLHGRHSGTAI